MAERTEAERRLLYDNYSRLPRMAVRFLLRQKGGIKLIDGIGGFDDALQIASLSMWECTARYDPMTGAAFQSFAWRRMLGAIQDEGRSESRRGGWSRSQNRQVAQVVSLEAPASDNPVDYGVAATIADTLLDPFAEFEFEVGLRAEAVRTALAKLPMRLRNVLALHYDEEMTLVDIGAVLGVSESRVCQLVGQAKRELRELLPDMDPAGA